MCGFILTVHISYYSVKTNSVLVDELCHDMTINVLVYLMTELSVDELCHDMTINVLVYLMFELSVT